MLLRRTVLQVLLLLALSAAAGAATKWLHPRSPAWFFQPDSDPMAVTLDTLDGTWNRDVIWVDARTRAEFETGHQEGAILLNKEEWNDLLLESFELLAASDRPIVVYCDGANCGKSKDVALALRDLGMAEVYYLLGGWETLHR